MVVFHLPEFQLKIYMAHKPFVVVYPDGSKKNIGATERNSLVLSKTIRHRDGVEYEFKGLVRTYHSFAELSDLQRLQRRSVVNCAAPYLPSYLRGSFVVADVHGRKSIELLETPAGLEIRLPSMIAQLGQTLTTTNRSRQGSSNNAA